MVSKSSLAGTRRAETGVGAITTVVALWGLAVAAGFATLLRFDAAPGATAEPANHLEDAGLARSADRPTLLVFLHPRCPCSEATLGELAEILARVRGPLDARIVFVAPEGMSTEWTRGALRDRAARIPGVVVADDLGGALARRFGARTSGATFLYDRAGRLVFSGGVTPSRGHLGDNAGRDAVAALLAGERAAVATSPVFGCPLFASKETRR